MFRRIATAFAAVAVASASAAAVFVLSATPVGAAAAVSTYVDTAGNLGGLTFPSGAIVDPTGRIWVADHFAGFCRIMDPTPTSAGFLEHPAFPGDTAHGSPTCMGGLLAGAGPGADATSTPSLVDPTPAAPGSGDEVALVPDGAAPSSEVFRFKWNPATSLFDFLDTVSTINTAAKGGTRPNASSLGPDGNVYVVFQKPGEIQRIVDPAGAAPTVEIVGRTSDGRGAFGVAAGRDALGALTVYFGGPSGVEMIHPNAAAPPIATTAPVNIGASAVNSLGYDLTNDILYVGTGNAANAGERIDVVDKFTVATSSTENNFATGFTLPAGISVRPDGNLIIVDDDAGLPGGVEGNTGRMFVTGLPSARITAGPVTLTNSPTPTFEFVVDAPATAECSVNGSGFSACTSPFTLPAQPDGAASFAVRAVIPAGPGVPTVRSFTVDTAGPVITITAPANNATVGGHPTFGFSSEASATFECSLDGSAAGPFAACAAGQPFAFAAEGAHTLFVRAIDAAGNPGSAASTTFTVDLTPPVVTITSPAEGASTGTSPVFTFASNAADLAGFKCSVDGGALAACTSPRGVASLAAGTHTFTVQATDAVGNVGSVSRTIHVVTSGGNPAPQPTPSQPASAGDGYWLLGRDGGIFTFGNASFFGSTGGMRLNQPVLGMTPTASKQGYWLVASDGGIFSFGDAQFFGSTGNLRLNQPIVGMTATPSGRGYWLVARDGGIFSFGDAQFFGSTGAMRLNQPIVGMAVTPTGRGYWLVASDGGIFSFGDAQFFGSTGNLRLNQPIMGMAATPSGGGYWLVARDGGIFTFGNAAFLGSAGGFHLTQPAAGVTVSATGNGYRIAVADGSVYAFGDATFLGSAAGLRLNAPIVGVASRS
jgi:hypothetical protein